MITRRTFLGAVSGTFAAAALGGAQSERRKRLAIVTTEWRYHSHAWHMGTRFFVGYPIQGRWHMPPFEVVAAKGNGRVEWLNILFFQRKFLLQ